MNQYINSFPEAALNDLVDCTRVKLVLLNIYQPVMQSCHNRTSTVATLTKAIITSGNLDEILKFSKKNSVAKAIVYFFLLQTTNPNNL